MKKISDVLTGFDERLRSLVPEKEQSESPIPLYSVLISIVLFRRRCFIVMLFFSGICENEKQTVQRLQKAPFFLYTI